VYVGDDREHDVEGARAAGLRAIDAGALATLAELPRRVEALNRESP
jgi:FMN phosphatase YigB (HAD superfamily)